MPRDAAMGSDPSGRPIRIAETQSQGQKAFGMFDEKYTNSSFPFFHSTEKQQNKSILILEKSMLAHLLFSQMQ